MKYLNKIRLVRVTMILAGLVLLIVPFILGPHVSQYFIDSCKEAYCPRHGLGMAFVLMILEAIIVVLICCLKQWLVIEGGFRKFINWITANDIRNDFVDKI